MLDKGKDKYGLDTPLLELGINILENIMCLVSRELSVFPLEELWGSCSLINDVPFPDEIPLARDKDPPLRSVPFN